MRCFHITPEAVTEWPDADATLPVTVPAEGFVWLSMSRREFEVQLPALQTTLQAWCGCRLVDLHVSDLLNNQLPSHYDYTSGYDLLVFRRLATSATERDMAQPGELLHEAGRADVPRVLRHINTNPVGFAVFDRVLLSVHPADCAVRDTYAQRLVASASASARQAGVRLPTDPADTMLRIVNLMVDGYLEVRKELTRDLDRWQEALLADHGRFNQWRSMLHTRLSLHQLDEICEDQRSAVQDWIEAIKTWDAPTTPQAQRDRELLLVRSRDVLEHVERVIHHVARLERNAEVAMQMHFSVQGSRTNDTMKTLTALTAVFLPLNLITGFFGMNFDFLPFIHEARGVQWTIGLMTLVALVLLALFWRKRFLARQSD